MTRRLITTIITRVLLVLGAGLTLLFSYWIIQTSLAPVTVPPSAPARKNVTFDSRLDVSKNTTFTQLRAMGPMDVQLPQTGRENPFAVAPTSVAELPVIAAPVATSTAVTSTSAELATSTQPF